MNRLLVAVLAILVMTGCSSMKIGDFGGKKPELVLEDYFSGRTRAHGLFEDRFGNVRRQFTVDIDGKWDGRELVLTEDFVYDDGETQQRVWRIVKEGPGQYVGRAADVIGEAKGTVAGNALNWQYQMDLKVGDGVWRVGFDDWMFLQADGVLLNRAHVTRWGVEVGSVTISFNRLPALRAAAE